MTTVLEAVLETCRRYIWGHIPLLRLWREAATAMVSSGDEVLLSYLLFLGSPRVHAEEKQPQELLART